MERYVIRTICSFNFVIFLLCLIEVSSIPTQQQEVSILDTMKKDKELSCKIHSLLQSDHLKVCKNLTYPTSEAIKFSVSNTDTFLCLGAYDSFYKICNYSSHKVTNLETEMHNLNTSIVSLLQSFKEEKSEIDISFCKSLKGLTPAYEKTKPLLSKFMNEVGDPNICKPVCFDFTFTFNPLCGVLAWINSIDQNVKMNGIRPKLNSTHLEKPITISANSHPTMTESLHSVAPSQPEKSIDQPPVQKVLETVQPIKLENKAEDPKNNQLVPSKKVEDIKSKENIPLELVDTAGPSTQKKPDTLVPVVASDVQTNQNVADIKSTNIQEKDNSQEQVENESETSINKIAKPLPSKSELTTISDNTEDHNGSILGDRNSVEDPLDPDDIAETPADVAIQSQNRPEPSEQRESTLPRYHSTGNEEDSHFFTYFTIISLVCIAGYVGYHNKQKVLAIVLEGRRSRSSRNRRRPSTASYRKLDCTLEEAVTSQCNANVTHVIY